MSASTSPLADHFAQIAPRGGVAATLHMLCDQFLRDHGVTPDFHRPGAFDRLVEDAAARPVGPDWLFDTVIVDEGQDFRVEWRDLIFRHGRENAHILWLEDPMQNLYGLPEVPLPGWVRLRANSNFRSPRGVVRLLSELLPETEAIEPAGPFLEADVEVLTYADGAGLAAQVKEGLRQCQAAGYRPEDMAIVTFRGREQSALFPYTQLGRHTLRTFTGDYDLLGHPQYSDGKVLLETVYRFKGQAAPAIIFAELDFETLDDKTLRKLFVGMTRARLKLVLVVSERAASVLGAALGGT
jgi:superfamily I DNA and RNA helicase